jgi:hypothetical protein
LSKFEYELNLRNIISNKIIKIKNIEFSIEILLKDCKGTAILKIFDKTTQKLKKKISFTGGLDLLSQYLFEEVITDNDSIVDPKDLISIEQFYQALPEGEWIYYDEDLKISRIETYRFGQLITTRLRYSDSGNVDGVQRK